MVGAAPALAHLAHTRLSSLACPTGPQASTPDWYKSSHLLNLHPLAPPHPHAAVAAQGGNTALLSAIEYDRPAIVDRLLSAGANIEAVDTVRGGVWVEETVELGML